MGLRNSARFAIANFIACVSFGVFSWSAAPQSLTDGQSLPDGPGKDVFESVCSLCHAPVAVVGKQWTRTAWEAKVTEMLQEEPDVTPSERATIVEYLAATFKPGGKIYVNKAAAKDLAIALELATSDAEAIVRYREEKGYFKTLDDLKKVSVQDAAKIEAKKDRLEFWREE